MYFIYIDYSYAAVLLQLTPVAAIVDDSFVLFCIHLVTYLHLIYFFCYIEEKLWMDSTFIEPHI